MFNSIKFELRKMLFQKKTYIVLFGHILMIVLCYIGFSMSSFSGRWARVISRTGVDASSLLDSLFFARAVMIPTLGIILPMFICTISGDIVAGEVQDGSLKLYLSRPRSRITVIFSKMFAMFFSSFACCTYFAVVSYLAGAILFKSPGTQIVPMYGVGYQMDFIILPLDTAVERYVISVLYYSYSIMALGAITLFFSTIFNRMTSATVAGLTAYFVCHILQNVPMLEDLRPYLFSYAVNGSILLSLETIPVMQTIKNILLLLGYIVFFGGLSVVIFANKDVK